MTHLLLAVILLSIIQHGIAQQPLFPAAIPLAVRSPYLSGWDFTTNRTTIGKLWPTTSFYQPGSNTSALSIPVHIRVDNITYSFIGDSSSVNGSVNLTNIVISPTQTKLTARAGPMQCNLTFLNPIEPGDWVKQSIPFSYLSLTVKSSDSAAHAVQVYSDVSGQWLSGDRSQKIGWSPTSDKNLIYHTVGLQNPAVFNEIDTQADWGTLYYAMKSVGKITYKTNTDSNCRGLFQRNGTLDNQTSSNFGPIGPTNTVFAISRDLGSIQTTQEPVVWTIGLTTNPAIQYEDPSADAPQQRSLYYKTQYPSDSSLILDFLNDFANASSRAQQLDSKILGDAATVSGALGDLVSLSTAQVYGSIQLTVGFDKSGNLNKSDVMAFMKNIGGPGSSTNRVNAVETLFSAFPAFIYIDPRLGGLLLEPLFRLQASPSYKIPYPVTDLGSNYPNVTISNSYHSQGIEQSGNMLIMAYAHARASGDGSLINRYYAQLTSWADYLSNYVLYTTNEISADGLSTNNQTNLAIKGIIAIEAMSKMSLVLNKTAYAEKYSSTAASLYNQWKGLALASDQHMLAAYGHVDTWTLGYNLFSDVWLNTSVVESFVYDAQSSFINNIALTSNFSKFGMPVDNYNTDTSTAASGWTLFTAAMTPDQDLRTSLISRVHTRASSNLTAGVFPVLYDSTSGLINQGGASPAQGAMYAPLALKAPVLQITVNPITSPKSHTGIIVGGTIGGVAAFLAIGVIALVVRRRSHRRQSIGSSFPTAPNETMIVTPFDQTHIGVSGLSGLETGSQTISQQHAAESVRPESIPLNQAPPLSSPFSLPHVMSSPIRFSNTELAQLHADNSRSQFNEPWSPGPVLAATTELSGVTSSLEAQGLQTEAPPGYEDSCL